MKELQEIQQALYVPKSNRNTHGNYNYRSAEDILTALKPLLVEHGCMLTIDPQIVQIGERYYVKTTVCLKSGGEEQSATGYAREAEDQKGMQAAQLTGSTSSYSLKYALGALFLLDGEKDADATNTHGKANGNTKADRFAGWSVADKKLWHDLSGEIDKCATPADVDAWIEEKRASGAKVPEEVKKLVVRKCADVKTMLDYAGGAK